jgi:nicotinate phosphoribosyltransferase
VARGAPIDAFGVGTKMGVSADAPYLDMAYKLVAYDHRPVLKLSAGKATWPAAKQVWRATQPDGALEDCIALADEPERLGARPLLTPAMRDGRRVSSEPLEAARRRAHQEVGALPASSCGLDAPTPITPRFSERLEQLRDQLAAGLAAATPA